MLLFIVLNHSWHGAVFFLYNYSLQTNLNQRITYNVLELLEPSVFGDIWVDTAFINADNPALIQVILDYCSAWTVTEEKHHRPSWLSFWSSSIGISHILSGSTSMNYLTYWTIYYRLCLRVLVRNSGLSWNGLSSHQ